MSQERGDVGSLLFVGTATTVLDLGPFTLLTDPNFLHRGQRVHLGYGLTSKRRTEPALQPEQLPRLDLVLLSHLHGDHFDRVARRKLPTDLPVVTTSHAARRLRSWGFRHAIPLNTWGRYEAERDGHLLRITSLPGTHAPAPADRLLPPVMGSMVELERGEATVLRLYVTGDTLYREQLRDIATRFPDVDAMIVHLGGTRILGLLVTMDGSQGADLVDLVRPRLTVPVHTDDYPVFTSPVEEFLDEVERRGLPGDIRPVRHGERIALPAHAYAGVGGDVR